MLANSHVHILKFSAMLEKL